VKKNEPTVIKGLSRFDRNYLKLRLHIDQCLTNTSSNVADILHLSEKRSGLFWRKNGSGLTCHSH
jgi:hypothetical protein